jgi:hypothetical protein
MTQTDKKFLGRLGSILSEAGQVGLTDTVGCRKVRHLCNALAGAIREYGLGSWEKSFVRLDEAEKEFNEELYAWDTSVL